MNGNYLINPFFSQIDVCKEGYAPVFVSNRKSFLWDKEVKGITLRQEVDIMDVEAGEKMLRICFVIVKETDFQVFKEAMARCDEWMCTQGSLSSSVKMNEASYQNVLELYQSDSRKSLDELCERMIAKAEFDYLVPAGKCRDYLIKTIPVEMEKMELNTLYRICTFIDNQIIQSGNEGQLFDFFYLAMPVEDAFVPYCAYLKVREQRDGKLLFDKATHYRHYKDFYGDIHYDKVCMEVEVNPALVCVELEVNGNQERLPLFTLSISSADKEIWRDDCWLVALRRTKRIVACCPLSVDKIPVNYYPELTVSLYVFDRQLAQFSILTDRTEPGELRLRKL